MPPDREREEAAGDGQVREGEVEGGVSHLGGENGDDEPPGVGPCGDAWLYGETLRCGVIFVAIGDGEMLGAEFGSDLLESESDVA